MRGSRGGSCAHKLFLISGEAFADGVDHGPADDGFVVFGKSFVVAHTAAVLVDPGQAAFDDPPAM